MPLGTSFSYILIKITQRIEDSTMLRLSIAKLPNFLSIPEKRYLVML